MLRLCHPKIAGLLILVVTISYSWGTPTKAPAGPEFNDWQTRIDADVLADVQQGPIEFLVVLKEQADLTPATLLRTKEEKGAFVFETLSHFSEATQKSLRAELDTLGAEYHPFWIANMIWVRGDERVLWEVARHEEVARIVANPRIHFDTPIVDDTAQTYSTRAIEWNLNQINAPEVWLLGFSGQKIVIGGQDTGYQWDHPALKMAYRGWDGLISDHNYNWHDTVTVGGGDCGANTKEPCDDHGHGTHTMGIMVGDDGGSNVLGVAPGAKWIGCRNMDEGVGTPASYAECYEWFVAPTDLNGLNPDPLKAPHVINNSWGCPPSEGCFEPTVLLTVVQSVRAAGIITVHSAGNAGPSCGSVDEPAAMYAESFSVGATDSSDKIADFSSRGPATIDGVSWLKPDVTAPGLGVRSSTIHDTYTTMSGTSMAAPHVAGLVALILSANSNLIGDVDRVEEIIEAAAIPRTAPSENCGDISGSSIPNNTYGWGRVDAKASVEAALNRVHFPLIYR